MNTIPWTGKFPKGTGQTRVRRKGVPVDPMVREMRRKRRGTPVGELERLLTIEVKWKRKATIARNKLADVRNTINQLAAKLALDAVQPYKPADKP